jgi:hypothetical protein
MAHNGGFEPALGNHQVRPPIPNGVWPPLPQLPPQGAPITPQGAPIPPQGAQFPPQGAPGQRAQPQPGNMPGFEDPALQAARIINDAMQARPHRTPSPDDDPFDLNRFIFQNLPPAARGPAHNQNPGHVAAPQGNNDHAIYQRPQDNIPQGDVNAAAAAAAAAGQVNVHQLQADLAESRRREQAARQELAYFRHQHNSLQQGMALFGATQNNGANGPAQPGQHQAPYPVPPGFFPAGNQQPPQPQANMARIAPQQEQRVPMDASGGSQSYGRSTSDNSGRPSAITQEILNSILVSPALINLNGNVNNVRGIPQPPVFTSDIASDRPKIEDRRVWLHQVVQYHIETGYIDSFPRRFQFFLGGKAAEWYTTLARKYATLNSPFTTVAIVQEFLFTYGKAEHRRTPMDARDQLHRFEHAQRHGEDIESYFQRYTIITNDIPNLPEEDDASWMLWGLLPQIRKHCLADQQGNRYTTRYQVMAAARAVTAKWKLGQSVAATNAAMKPEAGQYSFDAYTTPSFPASGNPGKSHTAVPGARAAPMQTRNTRYQAKPRRNYGRHNNFGHRAHSQGEVRGLRKDLKVLVRHTNDRGERDANSPCGHCLRDNIIVGEKTLAYNECHLHNPRVRRERAHQSGSGDRSNKRPNNRSHDHRRGDY